MLGRLLTICSLLLVVSVESPALAGPEKMPPERPVYPLLRGVSSPKVIPDTRKEPVYPKLGRELRLGAQVILETIIDESGTVTRVELVQAKVSEKGACEGENAAGKEKKNSKPELLAEASEQFGDAAAEAVKRWKYQPALREGVPTKVYFMVVVEFDPCPKRAEHF